MGLEDLLKIVVNILITSLFDVTSFVREFSDLSVVAWLKLLANYYKKST